MKTIVSFCLFVAVFGTLTEHSYTMGIYENYDNLNYADGQIDIYMLYTTSFLKDITEWVDTTEANDGWESDFDTFYEDEMDQLYLQFEINHELGAFETGADAME